jgi:uncharacterized protein YjbI with pentapeptide repeats
MANPEHLAILKQGVEQWNKWRGEHPDVVPSLSKADLSGTDLSGANLSKANLRLADLSFANLTTANLRETYLLLAELYEANLDRADVSRARAGGTRFSAIDLSPVRGLETIRHRGPSTIGIDTIYKSNGKIPEVFLRGCGVSENFITYMHSLAGQTFEYYSCFISYSTHDQEFAERLHADLQAKGVRCWCAARH